MAHIKTYATVMGVKRKARRAGGEIVLGKAIALWTEAIALRLACPVCQGGFRAGLCLQHIAGAAQAAPAQTGTSSRRAVSF
jgi:hypothetical protein